MGHTDMVNRRVGMEVIEGAEAGDNRGQGSRNVGIAGVGVMVFSVDAIVMDLGVNACATWPAVPLKSTKRPPAGTLLAGPLLREPLGDLADIAGRRPELRPELLRRKPAVKVR